MPAAARHTKPNRFSPPAALIDPKRMTPEIEAAIKLLRDFGERTSGAIYSAAWADGGEHYAETHGLRPISLSEANVGKLLEGLPQQIIDECREEYGADTHDRDILGLAKGRRKKIIREIVEHRGWMDHGQMFAKAGRPYALVGHPYQVDTEDVATIAGLAGLWGLRSQITTHSWYYPAATVRVEVYRRD